MIRQFDEIVRDYPKSRVADDAQYSLGSCYVQAHKLLDNSPQKAVEAFDYLIEHYPDSEFVDDACYWKAYAHFLNGDYKIAVKEYKEFVRKYPQSELHKEAISQMAECRSKLGGEEKSQPEERLTVSEDETPKSPPAEKVDVDNARPEKPDLTEDAKTPQQQVDLSDAGESSHVSDIRFQSAPEFTRVVMELSGSVKYEIGRLEDPDRIYVDIQTAVITPAKQTITINDKAINTIRAAQFDEDTVRVVLDVKQIQNYDISYLKDPDRLVVDVYGSDAAATPPSDRQEPTPLVKQLGLKVRTIVIDPGHGGKDPGAVSKSGAYEKSIVLDVAKRFRKLLESKDAYRVLLTRETDVFIPLGERTTFANEKDADIFISIHINSWERREAQGIETYYLSLASDEEARATAALENASAGKTISDLSGMLRHILRGAKVDESRELARTIQSRLCYRTGANDRGVKRAPFIVLIGAKAPSVLVELGFMSNNQDENRLRSDEYKEKLARALMEAVEAYIRIIDQTS